MRATYSALAGACLVLGLTFSARAEVTQPNGLKVTTPSTGGEKQLSTLYRDRMEAIDFVADGFSEPNTFSPLCDFKATFLLHEAGDNLALGWYNVPPAGAPAPSVFHIMDANDTTEGMQVPVAD